MRIESNVSVQDVDTRYGGRRHLMERLKEYNHAMLLCNLSRSGYVRRFKRCEKAFNGLNQWAGVIVRRGCASRALGPDQGLGSD